jgi:hypothetical protein
MRVRLSASRAGRPFPPGIFLVLISVRGWADPRAIVRLVELGHWVWLLFYKDSVKASSCHFYISVRFVGLQTTAIYLDLYWYDYSQSLWACCSLEDCSYNIKVVGFRGPVGSRIFSSPRRPDRFCGPPNLLSNGYRGSYPGGKATGTRSWPLTSN